MKADIICCCCISKHMTKEALQNHYMHAYITRARLTACEVGVFLRKISQLLKIRPPPSNVELLEFIVQRHNFQEITVYESAIVR